MTDILEKDFPERSPSQKRWLLLLLFFIVNIVFIQILPIPEEDYYGQGDLPIILKIAFTSYLLIFPMLGVIVLAPLISLFSYSQYSYRERFLNTSFWILLTAFLLLFLMFLVYFLFGITIFSL